MAQTTFRHGDPLMIDHTPSGGNVASGEVVLLGNTTSPTCGVAHHAITNATLGAVSAGGGVYSCVNLDNAADYALVYWDFAGATEKVTTTSTNNAVFGFVVRDGGGGANSSCLVMHWPMV